MSLYATEWKNIFVSSFGWKWNVSLSIIAASIRRGLQWQEHVKRNLTTNTRIRYIFIYLRIHNIITPKTGKYHFCWLWGNPWRSVHERITYIWTFECTDEYWHSHVHEALNKIMEKFVNVTFVSDNAKLSFILIYCLHFSIYIHFGHIFLRLLKYV